MLGIPPVNGLIPQAPLHTDSLCDKAFQTDAAGRKVEVVVRCHEQRVSNLMQASCCETIKLPQKRSRRHRLAVCLRAHAPRAGHESPS